jgi:2,4-dienoyl-CoA reductase-like NADH-dependent reductase (Old Yellow Enzyme family)
MEIIEAVCAVIPDSMPLYFCISSTDWMENTPIDQKLGSWDVESSIRLAKLLPDLGVDFLDVSSGGNNPNQTINRHHSKDYQIKIAARIRSAVKAREKELFFGAVGLITEAEQARDIVEEDGAVTAINKQAADTDLAQEAKPAVKVTEAKEPLARRFMREPRGCWGWRGRISF